MEPINDYVGDNTSRKNKWKKRSLNAGSMQDERDIVDIEQKYTNNATVVNEKAKKLEADWDEYKKNKQEAADRRFNTILIAMTAAVAIAIFLAHFNLIGTLLGYGFVVLVVLGFFHFVFVDIPEKAKQTSKKINDCHSSIKQKIAAEKDIDHVCHVMALDEVTDNNMDPYCLSLAVKESGGDQNKAISLYIKIRVSDLKSKINQQNR